MEAAGRILAGALVGALGVAALTAGLPFLLPDFLLTLNERITGWRM